MASGKSIKPVCFNAKNEAEAAMLKHVKRRNFSGYVKKLIAEDLKRSEPAIDVQVEVPSLKGSAPIAPEPERPATAAQRLEQLKQQKSGPIRTASASAPRIFKPSGN